MFQAQDEPAPYLPRNKQPTTYFLATLELKRMYNVLTGAEKNKIKTLLKYLDM